MKHKILALIVLATVSLAASAQDYNWSLGLRCGGLISGVDARINFDPANALHMMAGLEEGVLFCAMYERNVPVIGRGFNFYYGGGVHLGAWGGWHHEEFTCGIDVIAGLEYKMKNDPIVFALDYKPCWNFTGPTGVKMYDLGLSIKYCF